MYSTWYINSNITTTEVTSSARGVPTVDECINTEPVVEYEPVEGNVYQVKQTPDKIYLSTIIVMPKFMLLRDAGWRYRCRVKRSGRKVLSRNKRGG